MTESPDDRSTDRDTGPPADHSPADAAETESAADTADGDATGSDDGADGETESVEALRREVEQKYDFEEFGPSEMAEMSAEEWDVAFDPDTWITGDQLLDRVEADLKNRVASREVFARIERQEDRLVAYSDEGYATVHADGTVEGHGTVLRDVKPTIALCSMESYEVPDAPEEDLLPEPREVPEGSGELGNRMLQMVAGFQVLAGLLLGLAWLVISLGIVSPPGGASVRSLNVVGMLVAGVAFVAVGVLLFLTVANARLSDKFRAEEYRNRLRAVDVDPDERPAFLDEEGGADERLPGEESGDADAS